MHIKHFREQIKKEELRVICMTFLKHRTLWEPLIILMTGNKYVD